MGGVGAGEGDAQLSPERGPFGGGEVVVLEEDEEGRAEEEGGVGAVELRFAEGGGFVRGGLRWGVEFCGGCGGGRSRGGAGVVVMVEVVA